MTGEDRLEEARQALPGVVRLGGLLGQRRELGEGVLEHGIDQLALRRKVAIQRAHPDACVLRDLLDGDLDPTLGEQLPRARDQQLAVAQRIAPPGDDPTHLRTIQTNGAVAPFRGSNFGGLTLRGQTPAV